MAIYRSCYECGRTLSPDEPGVVVNEQFWVFPADDDDAEPTLETRLVVLCEMDAALDAARTERGES